MASRDEMRRHREPSRSREGDATGWFEALLPAAPDARLGPACPGRIAGRTQAIPRRSGCGRSERRRRSGGALPGGRLRPRRRRRGAGDGAASTSPPSTWRRRRSRGCRRRFRRLAGSRWVVADAPRAARSRGRERLRPRARVLHAAGAAAGRRGRAAPANAGGASSRRAARLLVLRRAVGTRSDPRGLRCRGRSSRDGAGRAPDAAGLRRGRASRSFLDDETGKTNTPEFGMGSHTYNKVYGTT